MSSNSTKPRRFDREVDGILLLDKPKGISSNAALQQARVLFRALKAGHAGSLDPMATGMLPICFGQATKVCGFLLDSRKSYRFMAKLGEQTDTGDADGSVIERRPIPQLSPDAVSALLESSLGEQLQVPPMYSALKHQGQRLYDMARRGENVERVPRPITIASMKLVRLTSDELEVDVVCSKGTYIRTLAEDLAVKLGTVAHLSGLRRIQVDPFDGARMVTLEVLTESAASGLSALDSLLVPSEQALPQLPVVEVDVPAMQALLLGKTVKSSSQPSLVAYGNKLVRMTTQSGEFLGIGEVTPSGEIQPRRLFVKSASGQ
jgi:tRNA pseudouridine55 synthase